MSFLIAWMDVGGCGLVLGWMDGKLVKIFVGSLDRYIDIFFSLLLCVLFVIDLF